MNSPAPPSVTPVRVSVLITTFNHERFVAQALDAIVEQRGVSFEVLVGDDASTDSTREVVRRYATAHPDLIEPFLPEQNMGGGGKPIFAELVRRSRGDYIAMLDGDDYWSSPDKLRRQAEYLDNHPECAMCFHDAVRHYQDGSRPDERYNDPDRARQVGVDELLVHNFVAACAPLFRREALDPLPQWYQQQLWGDWPLYFLAARHGELHYLPEVMGVYRIHGDGMYSGLRRIERLRANIEFLECLDGVVPSAHEERRRARLAEAFVKMAVEHERLAEPDAARRLLRQSFRQRPPTPRLRLPDPAERERLALWMRLRAPGTWRRARRLWARWRRSMISPG